ncbi:MULTISPECIES: MerR family transcriptional regulator [unclassified Streptomyces]|uniref:MerR family transcriptional regulator n=1 Tax=unclassified Streptomyces TaxID=2593676 RepID=UPI003398A67E
MGRGESGSWVTIGTFARLCRLSAKALRRYDELGLLPPALVDPVNGYRYYAEEQVETARLVAWLRRIGMPLNRIKEVVALGDPGAAAAAIRDYWAQVEAETAARRDLAAFLADHLSAREAEGPVGLVRPEGPEGLEGPVRSVGAQMQAGVPGPLGTLGIRYATRSVRGAVRERNQDAAYAGARLLAVADGFGARGAGASAAAIDALKPVALGAAGAAGLLNVLEDAAERAARAVRDAVAGNGADGEPDGSGTTLTAMVWDGAQLGLVHIGDSRAHLLRDGGLFRITHDHSVVQSMIDDGSLTEAEASSHPQRALLLRALVGGGGGGAAVSTPDVRLQEVRPGDRYLLCSDGLSAVVGGAETARVLAGADGPGTAVRELVALAVAAGGPDDVSCVVADVVSL